MTPPRPIAALYVEKGGAYFGLEGVDPWDEERDARTYPGPHPVVAHPPCNRWAQPLAQINQTRYGHNVGSDGGCFKCAVWDVQRWGGVLEHPANTAAWPAFGLPKPTRGGWCRDLWGSGWVTEVSQVAYGHPARKRTWLYYVGAMPPALNWSEPPHAAQVSGFNDYRARGMRVLSKREAKATPARIPRASDFNGADRRARGDECMSEGMNRATLIGNLGMDPELKFTQGGQAVLRLRLATTESYVDRNKERQERTEWHTVIVWGNRGEALSKFLRKGRSIAVEGRIQTRQWEDKDGNKRHSTEINASNIVLLGGKRDGGGDGAKQKQRDNSGAEYPDNFGDDDIPFLARDERLP